MSKNKKKPVQELNEDQPDSSSVRQDVGVSIMPQLKNGRIIFDIVRFNFTNDGTCSKPEIVHSTINEATAITLLFQTAHESLGIKELRRTVKTLRGSK